jgi:GT2 family glycosyltransferase
MGIMTTDSPLLRTDVLLPVREVAHESPASRDVDVSVVVITWNSAQWIGRCVQSIAAASGDLSYELLLHDNDSADDSAGVAVGKVTPERLKITRSSSNLGFAGGINSVLGSAEGRYVLLLNPDCELKAGAIARLVEYLDANPDVGAAAPLLVGDNGSPQRDFQLRRFPTFASLAADVLMLSSVFPRNRISSSYRYRDLDITAPHAVEQPAAAALLIRREVLKVVGPLDEQFAPAWFEDVDYCRRIWNAGYQIHLVPDAVVTHSGGSSLEHVPHDEFITIWYENLFRYARKWLDADQSEQLRSLIVVGAFARAMAATGMGTHRWATCKAYLQIARKALTQWNAPSRSS